MYSTNRTNQHDKGTISSENLRQPAYMGMQHLSWFLRINFSAVRSAGDWKKEVVFLMIYLMCIQ